MSLKGIAKRTISIAAAGGYKSANGAWIDIDELQRAAESGTVLYSPAALAGATFGSVLADNGPTIEVTAERTQAAAQRMTQFEGVEDLAVLSFASARNPGGGFINGAKAQEEDIARCSGIYPCLLTQRAYYDANREQSSMLYTDHIIFAPNVPWFRVDGRTLLDRPFVASIITAPAPNARQALRKGTHDEAEVRECLNRRARMVLTVAADQNHRNLLLGAWGCGVFGNQPSEVAQAFALGLASPTFRGRFDRVVFAILDNSPDQETLRAFSSQFGETYATKPSSAIETPP